MIKKILSAITKLYNRYFEIIDKIFLILLLISPCIFLYVLLPWLIITLPQIKGSSFIGTILIGIVIGLVLGIICKLIKKGSESISINHYWGLRSGKKVSDATNKQVFEYKYGLSWETRTIIFRLVIILASYSIMGLWLRSWSIIIGLSIGYIIIILYLLHRWNR